MPRALFTTAKRDSFRVADAFPDAKLLSSTEGEDQFLIGECQVTCCYRATPGDFVSRQVLGCRNAIKTGKLACADRESAMRRVAETQAVFGMVGPDDLVERLASELAAHFPGVLVTPTDAILAG